jgi:hypothetical protein
VNDRLASSHPELRSLLRASSRATQERVTSEVVATLLSTFPALAAEVRQIPSDQLGEATAALAEESDERYFSLQEACDPTHIQAFSLARAASAVAFASRGEPAEAIYEGLHALQSEEPLLHRVLALLRDEA